MKGCRPLTDREAMKVMQAFDGKYADRDRAIFTVGYYTGERISAILQLTIGDVVQNGRISEQVTFSKRTRKGQTEGRTITLHPKARTELRTWINRLATDNVLTASDYVFQSQKGQGPISRVQYHRILTAAKDRAGLSGHIATHSMRKSFANNMYEGLGRNIAMLARALGHHNINSTMSYLSFDESEIETAILKLS